MTFYLRQTTISKDISRDESDPFDAIFSTHITVLFTVFPFIFSR